METNQSTVNRRQRMLKIACIDHAAETYRQQLQLDVLWEICGSHVFKLEAFSQHEL